MTSTESHCLLHISSNLFVKGQDDGFDWPRYRPIAYVSRRSRNCWETYYWHILGSRWDLVLAPVRSLAVAWTSQWRSWTRCLPVSIRWWLRAAGPRSLRRGDSLRIERFEFILLLGWIHTFRFNRSIDWLPRFNHSKFPKVERWVVWSWSSPAKGARWPRSWTTRATIRPSPSTPTSNKYCSSFPTRMPSNFSITGCKSCKLCSECV